MLQLISQVNIKCIKNKYLTNENFKTSCLTLFSQKESHGLIFDLWCPYLCLLGTYIQALYKFFQKILYCLPRINTVWFITHDYNIDEGRASYTGRDEKGKSDFTTMETSDLQEGLVGLGTSPFNCKALLRPPSYLYLTLNCRRKAGQGLKVWTDVRTNSSCVILISTLMCPQGTTCLWKKEKIIYIIK